MIRPMLRLAVALVLALTALGPGAAWAAPDAEVGIEDERLLLSEPDKGPAAVAAWRAMGVDVVRLHARWFEVAPAQKALRKPRRFRAGDHRDRRYDWGRLDRAVALIREAGLRVTLTVTGPGPIWSTARPRMRNPRHEPRAREFGLFARAVATRYRNQVDRYSLWNEPNQAGWLQPQSDCSGVRPRGVCPLAAPHIYRALVLAAGPAIERADPGAEIHVGELAPTGVKRRTGGSAIGPLSFLRAFGCVSERYQAMRSGRCRGFRPAAADAIAHHPHGVKNGPERSNPDPDSAQIADIPRLTRVLDRLTRRGRIRSPGRRPLDVHLTEFSYQTSPPDKAVGISPRAQALFQQQAAYLTWRNPRLRSLIQYQWEDELIRDLGPGTRRYAGWQGGLRFYDGRDKPARAAFEAPFVADVRNDGSKALLWGQIRPGEAYEVTVMRSPVDTVSFAPVATFPTSASGTWSLPVALDAPGRYLAQWTQADGSLRRTPVLRVTADDGGRLLAGMP